VHRIVTELEGFISVQSDPARGTRFEILFPAAHALPSHNGAGSATVGAQASAPADPTAARPGESVLVVDDDATVLEVERQMIESLGYAVIACGGAAEAIRVLEDLDRAVSVLVTDLSMPGLSGIELAAKARELRPDLPMICCTGYGDDVSARKGAAAGLRAFVSKPVDLDVLATTLRNAIDAGLRESVSFP
jgi:CheY-like chemotaxis protein